MDQKSDKKPVNVNSETEEAENEMKKKTSKTVKSIAAVGFAVGGISAVQNFEAYAAEEENALEPEDSNSDGSDSNGGGSGSDGASNDGGTGESNGGSNDSGNGESGDNSQNESGETNQSDSFSGEQEGTNSTGNSNNTSDGQVETNSTENSGNAGSQDDAVGGTNDTQGQPANDAVVKDASKDSTETGPAAESTEVTSTEANASTSDTTEETTGPVTTITTETTTKDSLNDDGTTTTTTTVTTTTEKSDGTVTSDTKTSTETKETTYEEVPDKDAFGPGYKTEYYKSEEGSDIADQKIEKDEYDKLISKIDETGKVKVADEEYYYIKDGKEVPCTAADYQIGDIISETIYYKPTPNGEEVITKDVYDKIVAKQDGKVEVGKKYYYFDKDNVKHETDEAHYKAGKIELYTIDYGDGRKEATDKETYEKAQQNGGTIDVEKETKYTYTDAEGKTVTTDEATYNANKNHKITIYYKEDSEGHKTAITEDEYKTEMADGNPTKVTKTEYYYEDDDHKKISVNSDKEVVVGHHYYKVTEKNEKIDITEAEYKAAVDGKISEASTYYYLDGDNKEQTEYIAEDGTKKTVTKEDFEKNDGVIVTKTDYYKIDANNNRIQIDKAEYTSAVDGKITVSETKYFYYDEKAKKNVYLDEKTDKEIIESGKYDTGEYKYYQNVDGKQTEITEGGKAKYDDAVVVNGERRIKDSIKYYYLVDQKEKHDLTEEEAKKYSENGKNVYYTYYKVVGDEHIPITEGEYKDAKDGKLKVGEEYYYLDADKNEHTATKDQYDGKDKVVLNTEYFYLEKDGKTHHTITKEQYDEAVKNGKGEIYDTGYYVEDNGKKIYVNADSMTKTLTPIEKDGKYYIKDAKGDEVEISKDIVTKTDHADGWFITAKTVGGETKSISMPSDEKIALSKDSDGYYFEKDGEKLYVDPKQVHTYTSYTSDLKLVNSDSTNDATAKDKAMDFLNATGAATNFLVYADQFNMGTHLDGNICVNELTGNKTKEGIYASGHETINELDKYSIILNEKNSVDLGDLANGAVVIGTGKVNLVGHLNETNGTKANFVNIESSGVEGNTVKDKVINYLLDNVDNADANRLREEIDINGNLDKMAAAGQSLIDYVASKGVKNGSAIDSLKAFNQIKNNEINQIKNNEMLMLNINASELVDSGDFIKTLDPFLRNNKDNTNSRVIINVITKNESKISIEEPLNGNDAYNAFSSSVLWNFGNYEGEIEFGKWHEDDNWKGYSAIAGEGTLIAPKAVVSLHGTYDGSIVARQLYQGDKQGNGGMEIHQSVIHHMPVIENETATASPLYKITSGAYVNVTNGPVEYTADKKDTFAEILKRDKKVDVGISSHVVESTYATITRDPIVYKISSEAQSTSYRVDKKDTTIQVHERKHSSEVHDELITKKPQKKETTETVYSTTATVNREVLYDKASVSRDTADVMQESITKEVRYEDKHAIPQMRKHLVTLAKKVFKPVLTESYDKKVEKIPETPDKPDTPDTPHDDHDTPDTPHDDHDTPDTPKELHDRPETPEVLGASRPKEQEVLGASRPKVLGVTRAAKTGDARNMARNGFAAAAGAIVLAVWGAIYALVGRKHRRYNLVKGY